MKLDYELDKDSIYLTYGQFMLKAPVPARSHNLNSDESVHYLSGWTLSAVSDLRPEMSLVKISK